MRKQIKLLDIILLTFLLLFNICFFPLQYSFQNAKNKKKRITQKMQTYRLAIRHYEKQPRIFSCYKKDKIQKMSVNIILSTNKNLYSSITYLVC